MHAYDHLDLDEIDFAPVEHTIERLALLWRRMICCACCDGCPGRRADVHRGGPAGAGHVRWSGVSTATR
ncbi:DUF6417 family protein [Streptomyces sp. NPDC005708]|uniref:DUF6417 family protein n=1 Tax=Streptomyces sp. NPDC005708 TaxID=3154564 RepID=UPI003411F631